MKTLLLLIVLMANICLAQTNVITVNVGSILTGSGQPDQNNFKVTLTDTTPFSRNNNGIFISPAPQTAYTVSGTAYFTNVIWGDYNLTLASANPVTFPIQVQSNTVGLVDATSLLQITNTFRGQTNTYYTAAQVNQLLQSYYQSNQVNSLLGGYFPLVGGVWGNSLTVTNLEVFNVDSPTNLWPTGALRLGTNDTYTSATDVTITGLVNVPTSTLRKGFLTIVATANINVITPAAWHASDYVTTRVLTNGNLMAIGVQVQPGNYTNAYLVQLH